MWPATYVKARHLARVLGFKKYMSWLYSHLGFSSHPFRWGMVDLRETWWWKSSLCRGWGALIEIYSLSFLIEFKYILIYFAVLICCFVGYLSCTSVWMYSTVCSVCMGYYFQAGVFLISSKRPSHPTVLVLYLTLPVRVPRMPCGPWCLPMTSFWRWLAYLVTMISNSDLWQEGA